MGEFPNRLLSAAFVRLIKIISPANATPPCKFVVPFSIKTIYRLLTHCAKTVKDNAYGSKYIYKKTNLLYKTENEELFPSRSQMLKLLKEQHFGDGNFNIFSSALQG